MSLAMQLKDYRLTTARIYYHMPDYPGVCRPTSGKSSTSHLGFRSCGNSWISGKFHWMESFTRCALPRRT